MQLFQWLAGGAAGGAHASLHPEAIVHIHVVVWVARPMQGVDSSGHEREEGRGGAPAKHAGEVGKYQRAERDAEEGNNPVGQRDVAKRVGHVALIRDRGRAARLADRLRSSADAVKVGQGVGGDGG